MNDNELIFVIFFFYFHIRIQAFRQNRFYGRKLERERYSQTNGVPFAEVNFLG